MKRFVTYEEFLGADQAYFADRWPYLSAVIGMLERMEFDSCLELGTNGFPLVKGSDTMDLTPFDGLTYRHDAREPFPFGDKTYDLFVALQVWEHLDDHQEAVFAEVMRTCRAAVLSFPYLWHSPESPRHHGLGHDTFSRWTLGVRPVKRRIIWRGRALPAAVPDALVRGRFARAVYVFDFDKAGR